VDIFELALANPVQYEKVDKAFAEHREYLQTYVDFLKELSRQLQQMSEYIGSRKKIQLDNCLKDLLAQTKEKNEALKALSEVSEEDFEKAQGIRLRRSKNRNTVANNGGKREKYSRKYAFSSMLECGFC